MMRTTLLPLGFTVLASMACSADQGVDAPESISSDATAAKLKVPAEVLRAAFYAKPSSADQGRLGIVIAEGTAFVNGLDLDTSDISSGKLTSVDGKPYSSPFASRNPIVPSEPLQHQVRAFFDYENLKVSDESAQRLLGKKVPAILETSKMAEGKQCRVLGVALDIFSAEKPKFISLEATITSVHSLEQDGEAVGYVAIAKSRESTGGEGSLLICDNKLAGVGVGSGSQGTQFEFRSVDRALLKAFADQRERSEQDCVRADLCE